MCCSLIDLQLLSNYCGINGIKHFRDVLLDKNNKRRQAAPHHAVMYSSLSFSDKTLLHSKASSMQHILVYKLLRLYDGQAK